MLVIGRQRDYCLAQETAEPINKLSALSTGHVLFVRLLDLKVSVIQALLYNICLFNYQKLEWKREHETSFALINSAFGSWDLFDLCLSFIFIGHLPQDPIFSLIHYYINSGDVSLLRLV